MKTGLILFNSGAYGYFGMHWKDELANRGFDFFYTNPNDRKRNFQQVKHLLSYHPYKYLFITAGTIPLEYNQVDQFKGVIKILFLTDDDWQFYPFSRFYGLAFDWIITTYKDNIALYRAQGFDHVIHSQWGVNHKLFRPLDVPKTFDVSLIGSPHGDRTDMVKYLINNGIHVHLYGFGWNRMPEFRKHWQGSLSYEEMVDVINRTKINLNPSRAGDRSTIQIKGRTFELSGCRAFQLTEETEQLFDFFEKGKEIVTYESYDDLKEKISYFLKNELRREEISSAAYHRTLKDHTWQRRFNNIFAEIERGTIASSHFYKVSACNPKVTILYQAHGKSTLSLATLASLENQEYDNFNIYLVSGSEFPCLKGRRFIKCKDAREVIDHLDGKYVAFIGDGDIWAPEKLKFQVFALENESGTGARVSLSNFGLYLHEPENEILNYNLIKTHADSGRGERCHCIVLSAIVVNSELIKRYKKEFEQFIDFGIMRPALQKVIISQRALAHHIDMQYSLCKVHFKTFDKSLKVFKKSEQEGLSFWGNLYWRLPWKDILKRLLMSGRRIENLAVFLRSLYLKRYF